MEFVDQKQQNTVFFGRKYNMFLKNVAAALESRGVVGTSRLQNELNIKHGSS